MTADERRTAALMLWPDRLPPLGDEPPEMRAALDSSGPASLPLRLFQALEVKRGRLSYVPHAVASALAARRAVLGDAAPGKPRVLIRVDEFPHARAFDPSGPFGTEHYRRFHDVLTEAGVPYLLAITPHVSRDYLDPRLTERRALDHAEIELLREMKSGGVAFGLHGADHRTRRRSPRRHSELCGLAPHALGSLVDGAQAILNALDIETPVFVPPFNHFDLAQFPALAQRFPVVCGGPESVTVMGFSATPVWRHGTVYLPSYPPLYGRAAEVAAGIEELVGQNARIWAPVTLHWSWELEDDFASLRRLCQAVAGLATDWHDFLDAVETTRAAA